MHRGTVVSLLGFLLAAVVSAITIAAIAPTPVRGTDTPLTEFSAVRARRHIEAIAKVPHPVGSPAHDEVRAYLFKALTELGLEVRVQEGDAAMRAAGVVHAAHVENIVARLPGKGHGPAVMLAAHYDSVSRSRGASDDGSGVATLLETARALVASPPLDHPVLFVITDAEEVGADGALAYVDGGELTEEPVGVAMNFEARGSRGAVALYDTSPENGALIAGVKSVVPRVVSTSAMGSLARLLPNDSDATIWKRGGAPTLAFAFVDDLYHYHTYTDSLDALDLASVQHDGDYALPLARYFGDHPLPLPPSSPVAYFDVLGRAVVVYSATTARLLALLTLGLFVTLVRRALRAGAVTARTLVLGVALAVGAVLAGTAASGVMHALIRVIAGAFVSFARPMVGTVAGLLAAAAAFVLVYSRALRPPRVAGAVLGALSLWALFLIITAAFVPAASFVFQWPLLFALLGALPWLARSTEDDVRVDSALAASLVPIAFFWSYIAYTLFVMLAPQAPEAVAVAVLLPSLLVLPTLSRLELPRVTSAALAAASLLVVVIGGLLIRKSPGLPRPDALVYWLEKGHKVARWTTDAAEHDSFVAQKIAEGELFANAPFYDLPFLTLKHESVDDGDKRHVTASVSPSTARCVRFWEMTDEAIEELSFNGKRVPDVVRYSPEIDAKLMRLTALGQKASAWVMEVCGASRAGFTFDFTVRRGKRVRVRMIEVIDDLPGPALAPRTPADGYPENDSDIVESVTDISL